MHSSVGKAWLCAVLVWALALAVSSASPHATDAQYDEIFPTTVQTSQLRSPEDLNQRLAELVFKMRAEFDPRGESKSNNGGYHSSSNFFGYVQFASHATHEPLGRAVMELENAIMSQVAAFLGDNDGSLQLHMLSAWANVNEQSDSNSLHLHGNSVVSGCYYVDDGGATCGEGSVSVPYSTLGRGCLVLHDPRNQASVGSAGELLSFGPKIVRPVPGTMVLFPSWLLHHVEPHDGPRPRISIAFNVYATKQRGGVWKPIALNRPPFTPHALPPSSGTAPEEVGMLPAQKVGLWASVVARFSVPAPLREEVVAYTKASAQGEDVLGAQSPVAAALDEFLRCSVLKTVCRHLGDDITNHNANVFSATRQGSSPDCAQDCAELAEQYKWRVAHLTVHTVVDTRAAPARYPFDNSAHFSGVMFLTEGYDNAGVEFFDPRPEAMVFEGADQVSVVRLATSHTLGTLVLFPSSVRAAIAPTQGKSRRALVVNAWVARPDQPVFDRPLNTTTKHTRAERPAQQQPTPAQAPDTLEAVSQLVQRVADSLGVGAERAVLGAAVVVFVVGRLLSSRGERVPPS